MASLPPQSLVCVCVCEREATNCREYWGFTRTLLKVCGVPIHVRVCILSLLTCVCLSLSFCNAHYGPKPYCQGFHDPFMHVVLCFPTL